MIPHGPLAEVTRRDQRTGDALVESWHAGDLVVVGPDGQVAGSLGDPDRQVYVRSAVKPFQATVALEAAGARADDLTSEEVAVGWASHRGEPRHLDAVRCILGRIPLDPDQLTTPPAVPEAQPALDEARIHYNCSGKHALFALAGAELGVPRSELLDPGGPLQRRVLAELADRLGEVTAVGVDGCGAPAVRAPLVGLARAFRALWLDDRYRRVREAGLTHPGLVGGEGRLETALLGAGVLAKNGAEGVYGIGWRDGADTWGLAVKAADGAMRGASAAVRAILVGVGAIGEDVGVPSPVLGGGTPQGEVRASSEVVELLQGLA